MDSRLLAGAYSKRYKYIEREHVENFKNDGDLQGADVLAKARRLSQETNKRRKQLAQKRKQEAAREEKRRQEILNKRHQEQKQATEKYQRCHVGNRPRLSPSPRRRGNSPTRSHVNIEDALRLIRGGSASSVPNEQSREAIQRLHHNQQNGRDPLERSQIRPSRASSAGQRETRQSHNRPLSGRPLDASMRAQLMERSMRNLTSSRSRFEQQLEHHQQLLVEQQQKSLHDFNQAIRNEIDSDVNMQGLEENEAPGVPLQSESLSSLDSLEEGNQSVGSSLQEKNFQQIMSEQQREMSQTHSNNGLDEMLQQQRRAVMAQAQPFTDRTGRPQSAKTSIPKGQPDSQRQMGGQSQPETTGISGAVGNAHIIGPIPQGYYAPSSGVPVSSTPIIQGNLHHYPDSVDPVHSRPDRQVAVGTALRLPQQPPMVNLPVKQPPPTLHYDSQLLAHRRFEVHPNQNANATQGSSYMSSNHHEANLKCTATKVQEELTSALTQSEHPEERPKAHIYAWTSPPPEESDQDKTPPSSMAQSSSNTNSYSASMVADRVMATNLHPQTCRTISTAATTTCVYQTVNAAHNKEPAYAKASVGFSMTSTNQAGFGANSSLVEIPRGQGQKPGTVLTSAGTYPSTTGLKLSMTAPSSYQDPGQMSENRQQGNGQAPYNHYQNQSQSQPAREQQQARGGSIVQGTLGLVNGRLTTINTAPADAAQRDQKITVVEEEADGKKAVRSILKKADKSMLKVEGQSKFNVQDSLEIAKMHMKSHEQVKRKKAQKKGVRFADLHYPEEVEEDTDSADSMTDISAQATNTNSSNSTRTYSQTDGKSTGTKGTSTRPRPASARVVSSAPKVADTKGRVPRVASAGPARNPQSVRPKAAAHIIMSGEAGSQSTPQGGGYESGITAHKSQLDKKVMLINNNFMSRVPMYSSSATTETPTSVAAVYTVSGGKGGNAAEPTSNNGHSKTMSHGQPSEQARAGRGKSAMPIPHATVLPSHSHFSNANNTYTPVYNENGMRIDRTPTDDEINNLWKNMRTMLDVNDGKGTPSSSTAANHDPTIRQQVQLSHQYIDGASLGIPNGMKRLPGHTNSRTTVANGTQNGVTKTEGQSKNGYLQRYSLLQQRRAATSGIGVPCRTNDVVEQTVQPMPVSASNSDPWHGAVNVSYAPREEMSESMAGFLAAEQAVQAQGADVRESRVIAAMESAQNQQEMYNSVRQKFAKGGLSALSMEEHRLLESLDKLNDRLKVVENRQANNQQTTNYSNVPANHQIFVQGSGFRGHQVLTSQSFRRNSGGQRPSARPVSARLLTRPYR